MTLAQAIGSLIACALSLLLFLNVQRDRQRGAPFVVLAFGYAASLLWAIAAYWNATA